MVGSVHNCGIMDARVNSGLAPAARHNFCVLRRARKKREAGRKEGRKKGKVIRRQRAFSRLARLAREKTNRIKSELDGKLRPNVERSTDVAKLVAPGARQFRDNSRDATIARAHRRGTGFNPM